MRHGVRSRRLGRSRSERAALVRSLAQALFRYERIQTTLPKAKEAQRAAERLITKARTGTLAARRDVEAWLQDTTVTRTLFATIAPRFARYHGGYTRIVHAGRRNGDGATLAVLELLERTPEAPPNAPAKPGKATPPPSPKPSGPTAQKPKGPEKPAPAPKRGFMSGLRKFFTKGRPEGDRPRGD